jgi:hypothetical protein
VSTDTGAVAHIGNLKEAPAKNLALRESPQNQPSTGAPRERRVGACNGAAPWCANENHSRAAHRALLHRQTKWADRWGRYQQGRTQKDGPAHCRGPYARRDRRTRQGCRAAGGADQDGAEGVRELVHRFLETYHISEILFGRDEV